MMRWRWRERWREWAVEGFQGLLIAIATAVLVILASGAIDDKAQGLGDQINGLRGTITQLRHRIIETEAERDALLAQIEALLKEARRRGVELSVVSVPSADGATAPSPGGGNGGGNNGGDGNGGNQGGQEPPPQPPTGPPPDSGQTPPPPPPPPNPPCVIELPLVGCVP